MQLEIYLPWPPTVNSYYSHTRNGVFISKKGRLFRSAVQDDLNEQLPHDFEKIDYKMAIGIVMYPPDARTRDLDNYKKALLDACTVGGLWVDDSLIDQDYTLRGQKVPSGRVLLVIKEAGPVIPFSAGLKPGFIDF